ncbi:MAG: chromate transporter [Treponema sp.]|nr:chromate transporter [Treponema sp.]
MKGYLELFLAFFKMSFITFGGGYAIVPVIERELVKKRGWTTMDEVMDYYTIAQITPGIIVVNISTFIGYKRKGILGGILATLAFILPGASLIILAAIFISNLADLPAAQHAFTGIRIAVGALILDIVIGLVKGVVKNTRALAIFLFVFAISAIPAGILPTMARSPVTLVIASGLAALIIFRQKKEGRQ